MSFPTGPASRSIARALFARRAAGMACISRPPAAPPFLRKPSRKNAVFAHINAGAEAAASRIRTGWPEGIDPRAVEGPRADEAVFFGKTPESRKKAGDHNAVKSP